MIGHYIAWVFGGLFFANTIPHWIAGASGRPFQSPFAKPPGEGLSTSTVNVLWGGLNAVAGYVLLWHVGDFHIGEWSNAAAAFVPAFLLTLQTGRHFGRFNGGNAV